MSDGRASRADDDRPDLKWVVEWLVEREGQRKTAALLGVNRKTVALALRRERLTGRMNLAVRRLMANLDDPEWERTTPLDRLEARIQVALEVADELAALVESLTQRVEALEAAQKPEDEAGGQESRRMRPTLRGGVCVCSTGGGGVSRRARKRAMDEQVRWVTKAEAVREMEVSVSTLDRMIRRGKIEVRREGRRVYVRLEGPEYVSDDELLRRSLVREDKLQRTVWELDGRASELERERDDVRESASASGRAYEEMEEAYRKERAAHEETKEGLIAARVIAFVLLTLLIGRLLETRTETPCREGVMWQ